MRKEETKKTLQRILSNMEGGTMGNVNELNEVATEIMNEEQPDSDLMWKHISILSMIYLYGKEEGIRSEREKKKATNCN